MRDDPVVFVNCEAEDCDQREDFVLTALASGSWDERDVDSHEQHAGWTKRDGKDYCPGCSEDEA